MKTTKPQMQRKGWEGREDERDIIYNAKPLDLALMRMHLERKLTPEQERDYGLYYQ